MTWFAQLLIDIRVQEAQGVPHSELRSLVRKAFKSSDDSHLWPCFSAVPTTSDEDTRVVDPVGAAIAAVRRYERESGDTLDPEGYALSCREELARIVNLSRNLPRQRLTPQHYTLKFGGTT